MIRTSASTQKVFGDYFKLPHSVAVTIPSTVSVDVVADTSEWVTKFQREMSGIFGGTTTTTARGGWVSDSVGLVLEDVTVVTSYAKRLKKSDLERVKALLLDMKNVLAQEAVLVTIDGQAFLL